MRTEKNNINSDCLLHYECDGRAHEYFGVHRDTRKYVFRVFAPNAFAVYLISDATGWEEGLPLEKINEDGVWEANLYTYRGIKNKRVYADIEGMRYRYKIVSSSGIYIKCDPYCHRTVLEGSESIDENKEVYSIVYTKSTFKFNDKKWIEKTNSIAKNEEFYSQPLNIYEIHLGSFLNLEGEYLTYRNVADKLVPYVKQMGYTHVELMPVAEYSEDVSCGYHTVSYFAPTSRYGSPDDFKYFVNKLHNNGIGVILDWVPAHFSKTSCGMFRFDGGSVYENEYQFDTPWNTAYFDVSKTSVKEFLMSCAAYWIEEYHIDGLRFEAVSSMLYLDYDKGDGEWVPNKYGGNENIQAIDFIKQLNNFIHKKFPAVFTIAEESSVWNGVTHDVRADGLGFTFMWNTEWSSDMFSYMGTDPWFRKSIHNKLTFPMMYFFSEHYILPVTHDLVSCGNGSLIEKMHGGYDDKFANLRAFSTMQMTYPGKKHMFMGCEYGQFKEWNCSEPLEWFMLDFEKHSKLQHFMAELNHRYLRDSRLYHDDYSWNGFKWIYPDMAEQNVIAYKRFGKDNCEIIVVLNFSGSEWKDFIIPMESECMGGSVLLNSQSLEFGGNYDIATYYRAQIINGKKALLLESLPPLCGLIIEPCNSPVSSKF